MNILNASILLMCNISLIQNFFSNRVTKHHWKDCIVLKRKKNLQRAWGCMHTTYRMRRVSLKQSLIWNMLTLMKAFEMAITSKDNSKGNIMLTPLDIEGPSSYELARLVLCSLLDIQLNSTIKDYGYVRSEVVSSSYLKSIVKKDAETNNYILTYDQRAVDIVHALLPKEEALQWIANQSSIFNSVHFAVSKLVDL